MLDVILSRARTEEFRRYLVDLLVRLLAVDSTPKADIAVLRAAESECFSILEGELAGLAFPGARAERRPIPPAISRHPHFSLLHFTKTKERPAGLSPEEAYAGRANLVYTAPGAGGGPGVALDAHVDVVAPYFPPRVEGGAVFGRGACDDKGLVASAVGGLRLLSEALAERGARLKGGVVACFVVEEETGGNGSLAIATDRELRRLYDSVLVYECTDFGIHPANRGAVWYKAELRAPGGGRLEMAAFVNEEMEKEGRSIKSESRHPLFPQRPVQTCHGMIGPFGEHPSRICGEVAFTLAFERAPPEAAWAMAQDAIGFALEEYVGRYGDKTQAVDPRTGRRKVARHLDLRREGGRLAVEVHGSTGHMGSIDENDGAITKMSYLVRALARSRGRIERAAGARFFLDLPGGTGDSLVLEGGQGFLPTHPIEEVMERMAGAAARGAEAYLRAAGREGRGADAVRVTYEKLHNAAFDTDPDSRPMRSALEAAKACGVLREGPIVGWGVSCDARLFAVENPGMPVVTVGPGHLAFAHSDQEQIAIEDLVRGAEFVAAYVLEEAGKA